MAKTYYDNEAHRGYWSVHVEAWRRSGLSKRQYCLRRRLSVGTFDRWMRHLVDAEALKLEAELRREERWLARRRRRSPHSIATRSKAVQAFWAMHVEAMTWSGMNLRGYARALGISPYSLRRWRDRFDANEVEIDWRARLHPSAWPKISTGVSSAARESGGKKNLTESAKAEAARDRRSNRRHFSDAEKLAIVRQSDEPGVSAAEVCRRHDIVTSMLFRWRVQFGFSREARAKLVPVTLADGLSETPAQLLVLHDLLQAPDGMIAVELNDGRRVFAPAGSDPEEVWRQAEAREAMRC